VRGEREGFESGDDDDDDDDDDDKEGESGEWRWGDERW
jgi:hypothetical protein